jgi:hypothetical protein
MTEDNTRRPEPVPYVVHQATLARMDRMNRRLQLLCFSLIVLFAGTSGWRALRNRRLK